MKYLFNLLLLISQIAIAQNAVAELKFEEAETAFNNANYDLALQKVNEFEDVLGGMTDKSLYLRIISQSKLFNPAIFYTDENQFTLYNSLTANAKKYIEATKSKGLDDKFKEVYTISEKLKKVNFPKDKATYQKEKLLFTEEKQEKQKAIFDQVDGCKKVFSESTIDNLPFDITIEEFQKQFPNILGEKPKIEKRKEYDLICDYDIYHDKNISFLIRYYDYESYGEFLPDNFIDNTKNIIVLVSQGKVVGYQKQIYYYEGNRNGEKPQEFDQKYLELITKYAELSKCINPVNGDNTRKMLCENIVDSFTKWDFNNRKIILHKEYKNVLQMCGRNTNIYSVTLRVCKSEINTKF